MANVLQSHMRPVEPTRGLTAAEGKVVFASSLGTVFEWYDFYLYGSLAAIIAKHFFAGVNETAAFIFALLAFAAGFAALESVLVRAGLVLEDVGAIEFMEAFAAVPVQAQVGAGQQAQVVGVLTVDALEAFGDDQPHAGRCFSQRAVLA